MQWSETSWSQTGTLLWNVFLWHLRKEEKDNFPSSRGVFLGNFYWFTFHFTIPSVLPHFPFLRKPPHISEKTGKATSVKGFYCLYFMLHECGFPRVNSIWLPLHLPVDGRWLSEIGNVPKDTIDYYPKIDGGNSYFSLPYSAVLINIL